MSLLERTGRLSSRAFVVSRTTQQVAYWLYYHDQYFYSAFGVSTILHTRHRFEYRGDVELPKSGSLSYGVDYDRENASVAVDRHFRNNVGYYVQQQFEVANRLNVTAGIRFENNTTFGNTATPRIT